MSALAQRLAGLQRQAGVARPVMPVARTPHEDQISQLRKLLGLRPKVLATVRSSDRRLDGDEIAPGLRYIEQWSSFDRLPERMSLHGLGHTEILTKHVLAFDTETTGLAGGTGTRAFMIGAADWRDGGLRTRQLLTTTLAAESAMLSKFASWIGPGTVFLSYNGKTYDTPLLSTRYTLSRQRNPLGDCTHIDLLLHVRRRYKGTWENCRLITAERELLGIIREDDLPGSEAPAAWLDYLRGGSAEKLRRVGKHNAADLRSLWGILRCFQDATEPPSTLSHWRGC